MSKPILTRGPKEAIQHYLDTQHTFLFEKRIEKILLGIGFDVVHSGTYIDPVTKKTREFDLRAFIEFGPFDIALAIEATEIDPEHPAVFFTVPRLERESFHELIYDTSAFDVEKSSTLRKDEDSFFGRRGILKCTGSSTPYTLGAPVAKGSKRIGWANSDKKTLAAKGDMHGKISQALSSLNDLVETAHSQNDRIKIDCVLPLVVVPNDTLWTVHHLEDGTCKTPQAVKHVSFFSDQTFIASHFAPVPLGSPVEHWVKFLPTHVEIVEESELKPLLNRLLSNSTGSLLPGDDPMFKSLLTEPEPYDPIAAITRI